MGCNGETSGYRKLQRVSPPKGRRRLKGVKRVTGECRGLHGFTRGCSRLQGITRSYRGLEEVIGVTRV